MALIPKQNFTLPVRSLESNTFDPPRTFADKRSSTAEHVQAEGRNNTDHPLYLPWCIAAHTKASYPIDTVDALNHTNAADYIVLTIGCV